MYTYPFSRAEKWTDFRFLGLYSIVVVIRLLADADLSTLHELLGLKSWVKEVSSGVLLVSLKWPRRGHIFEPF